MIYNSIAKVFDYVIIELFGGSLQTTDMQFAYKAKHSTTLYAPWFILRLCIIMLTMVVTFIAVY